MYRKWVISILTLASTAGAVNAHGGECDRQYSDLADLVRETMAPVDPHVQAEIEKLLDIKKDDLVLRGDLIPANSGETYDHFLKTVHSTLIRHPKLGSTLRGSTFFHGTSSAALLAFSNYGGFAGRLMPIGILEKQGKVAFSGEIGFGRSGINQVGLSVSSLGNIEWATNYAKAVGWNPALGQSTLDLIRQAPPAEPGSLLEGLLKNGSEVTQKRFSEWPKLTSEEQAMVQDGFPVLFGIRPKRADRLQFPRGGGTPGESLLTDGTQPGEIKVVYVPVDRIESVKQLLRKCDCGSIVVEDISVANQ